MSMLYYLGLTVYLIFMTLTQTMFFNYFRGSAYVIILIFIIGVSYFKELVSVLSKNTGVVDLIYLIIISAFTFFIGGNELLCTTALVYVSRDMEIKNIVKYTCFLLFIELIIVIFASKVGVISSYSEMRGGLLRKYLGFRYFLYPSAIMFNIVAAYVYSYQKKIKLLTLFLFLITTVYIYVNTYAKLSTIMIIFMLFLAMLEKYFKIFEQGYLNNLLRYFKYIYVFLGILSILIIGNYSSRILWMEKLNYILEDRLNLANISLNLFGANLFGVKNLQWQGNGLSLSGIPILNTMNYLYVDNFYINIMQQYGIVFIVLLLILLTVTITKAVNVKSNCLVIILVVFAFHGLIDNLMLTLYYNIFLITLFAKASSLQDKNKLTEEEKW